MIFVFGSYHKFDWSSNHTEAHPDNKVHGVNMGPIWGRQDPDGPHVGPMNFAIWVGPLLFINIGLTSIAPLACIVNYIIIYQGCNYPFISKSLSVY